MSKIEDLEEMLASSLPEAEKDPFAEEEGDDEVEFDFSKTGEVPVGTFHARIAAASRVISSNGNPMISVRFMLPQIGRNVPDNWPLTPAAAEFTGARLRAVGIHPNGNGPMSRFRLSDLEGKLCRVVTKNDSFEGVSRPKIAKVMSPSEETIAFFAEL